MEKVHKIKSSNSNYDDDYAMSTTMLCAATSTKNTIFIGDVHVANVFNIFGKTTGTIFKINSFSACSVKYTFYSNEYSRSLLSFLNIVNNNDDWAYSFAR